MSVFGYVSLGGCQAKSSQTDTGSKVILFLYFKHQSYTKWAILLIANAMVPFAEGCQCLNTINILQIALSLQNISIKHINIKIHVYF